MGGAVVVFDRIIRSIQRTGGASVLFNELSSRLNRDGIDYREFGYEPSELLRPFYVEGRKRYLERYRNAMVPPSILSEGTGIFHSTCYRLPANGSYRVVTTVHDFTYELHIKGIKALVHSWQKYRAVRGSDHIICVSENTKRDLLSYLPDVDESKITVVYNGASDIFRPLANASQKPYVLFVGQRKGYKNFTSLVSAMSKFRKLELVCAGGGDFADHELALLRHHLQGRFRHAGYVTDSDLNRLYCEAFCLVYPSLYEGFGIPIIESMRAGCPVVAVNTSSIPEVAGDAALLVEDGESATLAMALDKLHDKNYRENLIDKGLVQGSLFSWERCFQETLKIYNRVHAL
ncbi:glycosyltransferase family 4 protein [Pusillimonas minor]|uniref:Glycosyltransferase family 4 protein n=1 Tax=Pusillimonas minor TaxID=2697024 RepID=A0A842HSN5_9BURK|nr:glycosyltransferase family 1 protein [Pusillimonas minor]MBC2769845.1 glycosyltransferase family 4 protein [Pusillimonas minor]